LDRYVFTTLCPSKPKITIDCASSLPRPRLHKVTQNLDGNAEFRFHHFNAPSLAHLLALVHHSKPEFPPNNTALLVIEDVSMLFPPAPSRTGSKVQSTPRTINAALQSTLLNALNKIAASNNVAVLLSTYVSTRMRQTAGALLVATHGSKDWEDQLSSRIIIFRDFPPRIAGKHPYNKLNDQTKSLERLRYAGIIKAHGKSTIEDDMFHDLVPFSISDVGNLPHDLLLRDTKLTGRHIRAA
jgi:hypothetical protein